MTNPYKVFHSSCEQLRKKLHIILVHPEQGGNVGAALRAIANMGVEGTFFIVGSPSIINEECIKFAKHAKDRIDHIQFKATLKEALDSIQGSKLVFASSARVGSSDRPHPIRVREAVKRGVEKLKASEVSELVFVFGCESDGLTNEDISLCDWVVTIPSLNQYRSLNLAQSILIFCHEANSCLLDEWDSFDSPKPSQKQKLVQNILLLAEEAGFIHPGDPFKMRPQLEEIFGQLPNHIKGVRTLHGLINQVRLSLKNGSMTLRGRFANRRNQSKELI